jgi:hypothetical protein
MRQASNAKLFNGSHLADLSVRLTARHSSLANIFSGPENFPPDSLSLRRWRQHGAQRLQHLSSRRDCANHPSPADEENDNDNGAKHMISSSLTFPGQGRLP